MKFFLQLCCALALLPPVAHARRCGQGPGELGLGTGGGSGPGPGEPMACPRVWPPHGGAGSGAADEEGSARGTGTARELRYFFDFGEGAGQDGPGSDKPRLVERAHAEKVEGDRGGGPGRVHVRLELRLPAGGTELLALPSEWAETSGLERGIEKLVVRGGQARLSAGPTPSIFVLRGTPGETVGLEYDLVGDRGRLAGAAERHRVLLRRGLMEFNGSNGLVAPVMDGQQRVHAVLRFSGLPAGQTVVTSFGMGAAEGMTGAWRLMREGLFVAGALRTEQLVVEGAPVLLAISGEWRFTDREAADKVKRILATERMFWRDLTIPWYAVVIEPDVSPEETAGTRSGADALGGGGTAFTHAFLLSLAPREEFGVETESLLAHEAFHEWNPLGMGASGATPMPAWFTEGVTTFYGDRLLERAKLLDAGEYLRRVNRIERDDELLRTGSGAHGGGGVSGSGAVARLDAEVSTYRAPYLHGALMAMWLDAEIRRQTHGARSLDDLMLALRADREQPLTEARVLRTAGYLVDAGTVERLRGFADHGGAVPFYTGGLVDGLAASMGVRGGTGAAGCVQVREQMLWSFDLGMDWGELRHGAVLSTVREGSAAWRAGLRNGQTLEGWEMWTGDPDHPVVMMVHGPEGRAQVEYLPRGTEVRVPQAEMVAGCGG